MCTHVDTRLSYSCLSSILPSYYSLLSSIPSYYSRVLLRPTDVSTGEVGEVQKRVYKSKPTSGGVERKIFPVVDGGVVKTRGSGTRCQNEKGNVNNRRQGQPTATYCLVDV